MSLLRVAAARLARRPTLAAALLYAVLSVAMVAQGLLPGRTLSSSDYLWTAAPFQATTPDGVRLFGSNGELADAVAVFQPFAQHARAALPSAPLWNPHVMAGRPFLADMQSAVLSPFSLPGYVLPFWWSLGVAAALKLWVAAFGSFLLGRALGMSVAGGLLTGTAFGLSLYMVTWLAWPLAGVWALLPWTLVAIDRAVRRPGAAGVAALALVTGLMLLCGHPESSFHVLAVAVAFAALRLSRAADRRVRRAALIAVGLVAGAGLAAIAVLPFLELVHHAGDLSERARRGPSHVARRFALGLLMPEYWGRPTQVEIAPFINARAFYVGALPLLLAGVALAANRSRERIAVAAAGVVAFMVVLGIAPAYQVANNLPGFSRALNGRLGIVVCLAVAVLAGWGLDEVLRGRRPPRWILAAAATVPAVAVLVHVRPSAATLGHAAGVAGAVSDATGLRPLDDVLRSAAALDWLVLAGAGAALLTLRAAPRVTAALAVALVAVDLLRFGIGQNPSIPLDHARQPVTASLRFLQARAPARFAGVLPQFGITALPADVAMRYDLQDARGYDYPVERRYDRLWRRAVAPRLPFVPPTTLADTTPAALRALGLLGVRSLLQQPGDRPLSLPLAYRGRDARIYDNPYAMPRAWVVERQLPVRGEDGALRAVLSPGFRPAGQVVVERALPGLPSGTTGGPARAARITRYEDERVELAATARRPSVVVLSDTWFPGWQATVDGREVPVERVDYLLRGVRVEPGEHRIVLRYRPASFRIGWIVSLLTAAALLAAVLVRRRRA